MRSSIIPQSSVRSKAHTSLTTSHNSQVFKTCKMTIIYHFFMLRFVLPLLVAINEWILTWFYCKQERIYIKIFSEPLLRRHFFPHWIELRFTLLQLCHLDLRASSPPSTSFKITWLLITRNWCLLKACTVFNDLMQPKDQTTVKFVGCS